MDVFEVMRARHSVRIYNNRRIEPDVVRELQMLINRCNKESGLHIQLRLDEPNAFKGMFAKYGRFRNVNNYIALVGTKSADLDEKAGYYGERIVLRATELGLGTCWVGMNFGRNLSKVVINDGEKLVCIIALGYFDKGGVPHRTKSVEELSRTNGTMPEWFQKGIEAVQLAPTAMNQQKFVFILNDNGTVTAKAGSGFYTKVDLGIAKYHFELGAGIENFKWADRHL